MKKSKKIIALLLSLIMIICSLPITAFAESLESLGELQSDESVEIINEESTESEQKWYVIDEQEIISDQVIGNVVEVTSLREENVKHFRLSDGTYEAVVYANSVHRRDANGEWQEINNNLELKTVKSLTRYETQDSRISFASTFKANSEIFTLNENGYSVSMSLLNDGIEDDIISTSPTELSPIPIVNNSSSVRTATKFDSLEEAKIIDNRASIVYNNIRENTNIEYILRGNDVKENIIITAPCEEYEYVFQLNLSGLSAIMTENGEVLLKDADTDEIKYVIPVPYMYDANGVYSYDVSYTLEQVKDDIYLLAVTADSEWINSTDRTFPVVIDPTFTTPSPYQDSYVDANSPNENFEGTPFLWVSDRQIAFIKINVPQLPSEATLNSAKLYMPYFYQITTGSLLAGAFNVESYWASGLITYNNLPVIGDEISQAVLSASPDITGLEPGTAIFDVTDAVSLWKNGTPNNGIAITRRPSATHTNQSVLLISEEIDLESTYISINYTHYLPDGVYAINHAIDPNEWIKINDSYYLDELEHQIVKHEYSEIDPTVSFDRTRLFKISRVENTSRYVIRSMLNNLISFNIIEDRVVVKEIPSIDENVAISDTFYIDWRGSGFTITPCDSSYVVGVSSQSNPNLEPILEENASSISFWTFKQYVGSERNGYSILSTVAPFVVGKTATFKPAPWSTSFDEYVTPQIYANTNSNYPELSLEWNSNNCSATVEFLLSGQLGIGCRLFNEDGSDYYIFEPHTFLILAIEEGTYYIQNAQTQQYATGSNYSTYGKPFFQSEYAEATTQQWEITYTSNSSMYATIRCVSNGMYLGVDPGSTDVIQYSEPNNYSTWKIETTRKRNIKLTCKALQYTQQVLTAPSEDSGDNKLTVSTYAHDGYQNDLDYDEWYLVRQVISIVNYFDASFENDSVLRSYIPEAVTFANLVYSRYFHVGIYMDGVATRKQTILDNCGQHFDEYKRKYIPCNASYPDAGNCMNYHHTNTVAISNELYNSPRENNHIYVLWTDRPQGYCISKKKENADDYSHEIQSQIALVYDHRPVIHFLSVPSHDSKDTRNISMAITLVHEIAHVFGLEEIYGNDDYPTHEAASKTVCVMEKLDVGSYEKFYQCILNNNKSTNTVTGDNSHIYVQPFCEICNPKMLSKTNNIFIQ